MYSVMEMDPFRAHQIRQIKAQLAGNGPVLVKSCNAELANLVGSRRARRCGVVRGVALAKNSSLFRHQRTLHLTPQRHAEWVDIYHGVHQCV